MTGDDGEDAFFDTVNGRYGKVTFFANDPTIGHALRLYGEWAQIEIDFCSRLIPDGGAVLDIGGFIGTHALAFSDTVGPNGHVTTFEPQKASFYILTRNLHNNAIANVTAYQAAVGRRAEKIMISALDPSRVFNFGSHAIHPESPPASADCAIDSIPVDSLDLSRCDFIKIDVEGMESAVIDGARETIRRFRPILYSECNSVEGGARTLRALAGFDYTSYVHVVDAFNPDNFFGETDNFFGSAKELAILSIPTERKHLAHKFRSPFWQVYGIETLDDLVYAMLQKPQYGDEVLRISTAAQSGGRIVQFPELNATQEELRQAQAQASEARAETDAAKADLAAEAQSFTNDREHLEAELGETRAALARQEEEAERHGRFLRDISEQLEHELKLRGGELTEARQYAEALETACSSLGAELQAEKTALAERDALWQEAENYGRFFRDISKQLERDLNLRSWELAKARQHVDALKNGRYRRTGRSMLAITSLLSKPALRLLNGKPCPLFDEEWYFSQYPDVLENGMDGWAHYLRYGAYEGRNPNYLFDSAWYISQYPDIAEKRQNPLLHYWRYGAAEGRNPAPLFSTRWYLEQNPDVQESGGNALLHFLSFGDHEGRSPGPAFNSAAYKHRNGDLADNIRPVFHYVQLGRLEGRSPEARTSGAASKSGQGDHNACP